MMITLFRKQVGLFAALAAVVGGVLLPQAVSAEQRIYDSSGQYLGRVTNGERSPMDEYMSLSLGTRMGMSPEEYRRIEERQKEWELLQSMKMQLEVERMRLEIERLRSR